MRHIRVHRIPSRVRGDRDPPLIGMERANNDFDLGSASSDFLQIRKYRLGQSFGSP
jgi:hypothetical protein